MEEYKRINGDISIEFLTDFIEFLRKKDFIFNWDD
jgi:hypothetical protein